MAEALCKYIENDRPFLGICLGLQLLFESSEENGPGLARFLHFILHFLESFRKNIQRHLLYDIMYFLGVFFYLLICIFVLVNGLGVIPGIVGRFDSSAGIRVPHIGWNALQVGKDSEILDDVGNRHVYFVHSYRAIPVWILIFFCHFRIRTFVLHFFYVYSKTSVL